MIKEIIKKVVPKQIKLQFNAYKNNKLKEFRNSLPNINENNFYDILTNRLGLIKGDTVFIHSSLDKLNLNFPVYNVLNILLDIVGNNGTILFPTYPKLTSYKFLKSGQVFNIKKTISYMGLLSEFARRHTQAIRSLHPTKSVVAIGELADELTNSHHLSPYPYDINSPYYKITNYNAKIIGIGVDSTYLSCVHCADDYLKKDFPVNPYYKELFQAKCINYKNETVIVPTFAHNMFKMDFDLPKFFMTHFNNDIIENHNIEGMKFFRSKSKELINGLIELAKQKVTIYSRIHYRRK